jgi:molecular chaperone GrpE (heat shock protein)
MSQQVGLEEIQNSGWLQGGTFDPTLKALKITINIKTGFKAVKIPGDPLKKEGAAEVFRSVGGSSSDSLELYRAVWTPVTDREREIAGTVRNPASPGTQIVVSPDWAAKKLKAVLQDLQATWMISPSRIFGERISDEESEEEPLGNNKGFYIPAANYAAFQADRVAKLDSFAEELREILLSVFDAAQANFVERFAVINAIANFSDEDTRRVFSKFPKNPAVFSSKFGISQEYPVVVPSLLERVQDSAAAMEAIASAHARSAEADLQASIERDRRQALRELADAQRQGLDRVIDKLLSHVADSLSQIETANQSELTEAMKRSLLAHSEQVSKMVSMVNALSGLRDTGVEQVAAMTEEVRTMLFSASRCQSDIDQRLQVIKNSLQATLKTATAGAGTREIAKWCDLTAVTPSQVETHTPASSLNAMLLDQVTPAMIAASSMPIVIASDEEAIAVPATRRAAAIAL